MIDIYYYEIYYIWVKIGKVGEHVLKWLGVYRGKWWCDGFDIMQGNNQVLAYRYEEERLYISTDLIRDIRDIFGLPQKETMWYIRNWFQDQYNTRAKTVWLLFPDEPFTY